MSTEQDIYPPSIHVSIGPRLTIAADDPGGNNATKNLEDPKERDPIQTSYAHDKLIKGTTPRKSISQLHEELELEDLDSNWSPQMESYISEYLVKHVLPIVYILSGTLTLIDDNGEHILTQNSFAGFPAGRQNGHQLANKSSQPAIYLEIGSRKPGEDTVHYPDDDIGPIER